MSRTVRRKNVKIPRWWFKYEENPLKFEHLFYSDNFDVDSDPNPPKWFKQVNQRKFRHRVDRELRQGNEFIEKDYKMPYYT